MNPYEDPEQCFCKPHGLAHGGKFECHWCAKSAEPAPAPACSRAATSGSADSRVRVRRKFPSSIREKQLETGSALEQVLLDDVRGFIPVVLYAAELGGSELPLCRFSSTLRNSAESFECCFRSSILFSFRDWSSC